MINAQGVEGSFLEYKGRPLVRQENEIYYGDLSEDHHVYMMIMSEKPSTKGDEEQVPDRILVQLKDKEGKVKQQTLSAGLSDAFEMATAWLDRFNK